MPKIVHLNSKSIKKALNEHKPASLIVIWKLLGGSRPVNAPMTITVQENSTAGTSRRAQNKDDGIPA